MFDPPNVQNLDLDTVVFKFVIIIQSKLEGIVNVRFRPGLNQK